MVQEKGDVDVDIRESDGHGYRPALRIWGKGPASNTVNRLGWSVMESGDLERLFGKKRREY
jgi:hypothetical protein